MSIPWGLPGDPGEPRNLRIPSFLICKSGMQIHTSFFVVFVMFCWLPQCRLPNLELLWGIQPPYSPTLQPAGPILKSCPATSLNNQ